MNHDRQRPGGGVRAVAMMFAASVAASIGLTVLYALGGQPQLEGALLAVALGGIAVGLVLWAKRFMPRGPFVQERERLASEERADDVRDDLREPTTALPRRGLLVGMLSAAAAALGVAALFPIRSLGRAPERALFHTAWTPGARLVTRSGRPVRARDVAVNTVLTVFPEDHTDAADSQTLLIRLQPGEYRAPPGRETWAPDGFVAFSKVCTHAGCPVGLYQTETRELFCPCHQSVFAVLEGARPTGGPATRHLPQLPLAVDDDGYLIATGDFPEPVGPGFWSIQRG